MVPRKPLQLVSYKIRFNIVSRRMVGLELTSLMAATIAGFAERPITELTVNKAPTFITLGILDDDDGTVVFLVTPLTVMGMGMITMPKTKKLNHLLIIL